MISRFVASVAKLQLVVVCVVVCVVVALVVALWT